MKRQRAMAKRVKERVERGVYWLEGVGRVMRILDCFTDGNPELRLTDLSERSGITKTQVLRIASTLETGGDLHPGPESRRERPGGGVVLAGNPGEKMDDTMVRRPP